MTRGLLRLACLVALLGLGPSGARAWCQLTTANSEARPGECVTEGEPLRWERRCLSYTLDAEGSSDLPLDTLRTVVEGAFEEWTTVDCDGTPVGFEVRESAELAQCDRAEHRSEGPNLNVIAFRDEWPGEYPEDAYAVTSVWHRPDDGEIVDADILVNESLGPYTLCPDAGCTEPGPEGLVPVDLPNVLTHEIGHVLGLAHSQFGWAAMAATSPRGETRKRTAWSDDTVGLCAIYPPGSLPASCDFEPRGGLATTCPDDGCVAAGAPAGGPGGLLAALGGALALLLRRRK